MEKNIKDYLHLYLGSADYSVRYVDYDPGVWTLFSKLTPDRYLRIINDAAVENIQLRLRKLESMTLPEAVSLFDLIGKGPSISDQAKAYQVKDFICTSKFYNGTTNLSGSDWVKIIDWLREKGFDCNGLIESGLAIEKQPTTQNQGV